MTAGAGRYTITHVAATQKVLASSCRVLPLVR